LFAFRKSKKSSVAPAGRWLLLQYIIQLTGIGSGQAAIEQCIELASRPQVAQQWRKCHHLIIDEISMVDGDFFDKLEAVARLVRKFNISYLFSSPVTKFGVHPASVNFYFKGHLLINH
jgi:hypothetical protein